MGRELLFRAWDGKKIDYDPVLFGTELGECFINSAFLERANHDGIVFMQYTGLKDKKGKEIYEGDIVRQGNRIHSVEWDLSCTGFLPFAWADGDECVENRCEVIGNIHEHPHLLGENKAGKH